MAVFGLFLANWWVNSRSLLLRNESHGGHWLDVTVAADSSTPQVNRQGIGTVVRVYTAGQLGQAASLLGVREISAGYGYASGQEAAAHFGLGDATSSDVEVTLPHGRGKLVRRGTATDQRISLPKPIGP